MKKIKLLLFFQVLYCFYITNVDASTIKEGNYIIRSSINENMVIDLSSANIENSSNIQLFSFNNTPAQKWEIKFRNGYYTIYSSLANNKVIDIKSGIKNNGSNIQIYESNNTSAQKWNIRHVGSSLFEIVSDDGAYCLDAKGGQANNGTNIQIYKCNGTKAQRFKLVEIVEPSKTIEDGVYTISTALDNNKLLDVAGGKANNKTNIQIYSNNNTKAQKWIIKYLNNGYYSITSKVDKSKCLDVDGGKFISGSNIQLYTCNNTEAQKWIIKDIEDGYYQIITSKDSIPLDIAGANTTNGTNVQLYFNNLTAAQKFKLNKIDERFIDNGIYNIVSDLNTNMVLDVTGANSFNNTNVQLYTNNSTNAQKWYIDKLEDNSYQIKSVLNSGLLLSYDNNNILVSNTNTKWTLEFVSENSYYLVNNKGLYLNVDGSNVSNGTNINLLTSNESKAQIFHFVETNVDNNNSTQSNSYYTIETVLKDNKVIDASGGEKLNGTNIQLYDLNNTNAQIWYLKHTGSGYYSIISALNPNVSLDVAGGIGENGANIQLYKKNSTTAQEWQLIDDRNGGISIKSRLSNVCLTIDNSKTDNKTNIYAATCNNQNNQKFRFNKYSGQKKYKGIDVSQYQGNINWYNVAKTNLDFAIIRAGYGDNWTSQDDKKFLTYVNECEKYNIPYGVYLYSYAKNVTGASSLNSNSESADSEAAHVIRLINSVSYKPNLKTSVYIDMEEDSLAYLGKQKLTSIANRFCQIINNNGYECSVYANNNWLKNNLDAKAITNNNAIWIAEWGKATTYNTAITISPSYNLTKYKLWQFHDNGSINGISGPVDLDIGYDIFD